MKNSACTGTGYMALMVYKFMDKERRVHGLERGMETQLLDK